VTYGVLGEWEGGYRFLEPENAWKNLCFGGLPLSREESWEPSFQIKEAPGLKVIDKEW